MWRTASALVLLVAVWCFHSANSLYIKDFQLKDDTRGQIFLESFGFKAGGHMEFNITNVKIEISSKDKVGDTSEDHTDANLTFFVLKVTDIDVEEFEDTIIRDTFCPKDLNKPIASSGILGEKISIEEATKGIHIDISKKLDSDNVHGEGIYNLFYINCHRAKTTFTMNLQQYNVDSYGKNYLPVGFSPLPTIYGMFTIIYVVVLVIWIFGYMRAPGAVVNKVHYLMSVLVLWKLLSLLFYAIDQHYLKRTGVPNGWAIAYYIFAVLRTAFFFVIVTLIGTGWTFFKPFLSDKDKKIIMVVIPLQVLDNIAMIIVGTNDPGFNGWIQWKDIFRLVDIICCGAVLIPIIWSIKHLREASQSDGKAARNLQKLKLFRQFYLIVVSYIYFTRIIIYLLDAALPFKLLFLGDLFTETATLIFFLVVGHMFRPVSANPYFNVEEEDAARSEEMRSIEED